MLKTAPEDQLLTALEAILRTGLPPHLDGTEWTGDECPAGHWLMPEGARLYRYDVPANIVTPCAIFYFEKDSQPYDTKCLGGDELWWLFCAVDLIWDRDLTAVATRQLRDCLRDVFCADLADPIVEAQRLVTARLSLAADTDIPGIQVGALRDIICTTQKSREGHPEFNLTFTVLASGIPPL